MAGKFGAFVHVKGFLHGRGCFAGQCALWVGQDPLACGTSPSRETLILKPNQFPGVVQGAFPKNKTSYVLTGTVIVAQAAEPLEANSQYERLRNTRVEDR
jgi:hypothetical protein